MEEVYPGGPFWDPEAEVWRQVLVELPKRAGNRPLLLVPKAIVRLRMDYDADEYYDDYIIPLLRDEEIQAGSSLVEVLKNGKTKRRHIAPAIPHAELAALTGTAPLDLDALLATLAAVKPGRDGAKRQSPRSSPASMAMVQTLLRHTLRQMKTPGSWARRRCATDRCLRKSMWDRLAVTPLPQASSWHHSLLRGLAPPSCCPCRAYQRSKADHRGRLSVVGCRLGGGYLARIVLAC